MHTGVSKHCVILQGEKTTNQIRLRKNIYPAKAEQKGLKFNKKSIMRSFFFATKEERGGNKKKKKRENEKKKRG